MQYTFERYKSHVIIRDAATTDVLLTVNPNGLSITPTKDKQTIVFTKQVSAKKSEHAFTADITEISGRPDNNIYNIVRWLIDNFFFDSNGMSNIFIIGTFTNYTDLITREPAGRVGRLSYVLNSQGTAWLPGSLGGTYRGVGWYYDDGTNWVEANEQINLGLYQVNQSVITLTNTKRDITAQRYSLTDVGGFLQLVNDLPVIPPNQSYGTNDLGVLGYYNTISANTAYTLTASAITGTTTPAANEFTGITIPLSRGTYNKAFIYLGNSNPSGTNTFRAAIYEVSTGNLLGQGATIVPAFSATSSTIQVLLSASISIYTPTEVFFVTGINDSTGGGTIRRHRETANGLADSNILFTFTQASGVLAANLSSYTRTASTVNYFAKITGV